MIDAEKRLLLLERKKAILQARTDLVAFARYLSPDPEHRLDARESSYEVARHHQVIAAALEEVEAGNIKRLIISVPPRHGKTRLASMLFPAWFLGRNPQKSVVFATYNDKYATDIGSVVKTMLQSPLYAHVFPELKLAYGGATTDRLRIADGGDMFCVGVGGSLTGRGAHCSIIDDATKNRQEANSIVLRDRLWAWYTSVFRTRMMTKDAATVVIGTRWSADDLIGRIIDPTSAYFDQEEAESWRIINLPALAEEDDALGRKLDEPLWPARFDTAFLNDQRRSDPRGFSALYQGRPSPAEGAFFRSAFIRVYNKMSDLPPKEAMRFYGSSDFAVATRQEADKSCHLVVGIDENDNIYVMPDIVWSRLPSDMSIDAIIHLMAKYHPMIWWGERGMIEKSIGPFLRKRMLEKRVFCTIDNITPIADKLARAQSINARMSMGRVYLPSFTRWFPDARDQLLTFPRGTHDDFVDALSLVGLGLMKQAPAKGRPREQPVGPREFTLGWVRENTKRHEREMRDDW